MRSRYHETHLMSLGEDVPEGGRIQRGWNQLVGAAYERRIYAFRFETSEAQDDAFIATDERMRRIAPTSTSCLGIAPTSRTRFWISISRTLSGGTSFPTQES